MPNSKSNKNIKGKEYKVKKRNHHVSNRKSKSLQ